MFNSNLNLNKIKRRMIQTLRKVNKAKLLPSDLIHLIRLQLGRIISPILNFNQRNKNHPNCPDSLEGVRQSPLSNTIQLLRNLVSTKKTSNCHNLLPSPVQTLTQMTNFQLLHLNKRLILTQSQQKIRSLLQRAENPSQIRRCLR